MASHVFVVDSTFKRTQVKVTPGKYLREVLEEACKSRKLSPEGYTLKRQDNKNLDLAQPFRLSGLSAGAKLQLVQASKSPGVVSVALQLLESEGVGRLVDKFPSNTSLWLVLRKFEDAVAGTPSKKLNLTQRGVPTNDSGSGRLMYEQPCLNVAGRSLDTFSDLQKTLAQLGLNGGSALIRLDFRSTETPLEEAMSSMSEYFTSIDGVSAGASRTAIESAEGAHAGGHMASRPDAHTETPLVPAEEHDATQEPNEDVPMVDGPIAQSIENDIIASSSETAQQPEPTPEASRSPSNTINGMSVYRPPSSSTPAAAQQPDDPSVFEPTIDHAKSHLAALQSASKNKRLLSDKELEEQEAIRRQNLSIVQTITVRVRYPDQSQTETTLPASETAADLYAKIMDTLAAAPEPFELRYTGTKGHETLPNSATKRLVRDLGFRGKILVTLVWSPEASVSARQGPSLKEEYRKHATDLKVQLASQQTVGETAHQSAMQKGEKSMSGEGKGKGDLEAKMKKFLGFGKK